MSSFLSRTVALGYTGTMFGLLSVANGSPLNPPQTATDARLSNGNQSSTLQLPQIEMDGSAEDSTDRPGYHTITVKMHDNSTSRFELEYAEATSPSYNANQLEQAFNDYSALLQQEDPGAPLEHYRHQYPGGVGLFISTLDQYDGVDRYLEDITNQITIDVLATLKEQVGLGLHTFSTQPMMINDLDGLRSAALYLFPVPEISDGQTYVSRTKALRR